ncbi:YxiG family protein [Clostridium thermarum]|uniref:YxiG family protein n=1 Tax=Clostridium thermarum TaxID=1716543 RepID=UPI0011234023|nr:hypothetical protein [Clostridium thermarum]
MNINKLLESLWGTIIEEFDINMKEHYIKLVIKSCENNIETSFIVIFKDVTAYSWVNSSFEQGKDRSDIEQWTFMDLTSITYNPNAKLNVEGSLLNKKIFAKPNFLLEIWNTMLLIEANKLIINDNVYDLNKDN